MVWMEPFHTKDVDFFVHFSRPSPVIDLSPVWETARQLGYLTTPQGILIAGVPVEILPAPSKVVEEGLRHAIAASLAGVEVPVLPVEYLLAEATLAGRATDRVRIERLLDQAPVDFDKLNDILKRHGLVTRWQRMQPPKEAKTAAQQYIVNRKRRARRAYAAEPLESKLRDLDRLQADVPDMIRLRNAVYQRVSE